METSGEESGFSLRAVFYFGMEPRSIVHHPDIVPSLEPGGDGNFFVMKIENVESADFFVMMGYHPGKFRIFRTAVEARKNHVGNFCKR